MKEGGLDMIVVRILMNVYRVFVSIILCVLICRVFIDVNVIVDLSGIIVSKIRMSARIIFVFINLCVLILWVFICVFVLLGGLGKIVR